MKITIRDYHISKEWLEGETKEFEEIEDNITSVDVSDGGSEHEIVLKHLKTGKFYGFCASDWEIGYDFTGEAVYDNEIPNVKEVFAKTKQITYYE